MKKLEAIIRPSQLHLVRRALKSIGIEGMTVSQVTGFGQEIGYQKQYRGNEIEVDSIDKLKIEILLPKDLVDNAIDVICKNARTGAIGDGKIIITPVDKIVRIRTGETNDDAM